MAAALIACGGQQYFVYANHGAMRVYIEDLAGCLTLVEPGATAVADAHNVPYQDEYWTVYDASGLVLDRPGNTCADQGACAQGTVVPTRVRGVNLTLTETLPLAGLAPCASWPFPGTMPPVQPTPAQGA